MLNFSLANDYLKNNYLHLKIDDLKNRCALQNLF